MNKRAAEITRYSKFSLRLISCTLVALFLLLVVLVAMHHEQRESDKTKLAAYADEAASLIAAAVEDRMETIQRFAQGIEAAGGEVDFAAAAPLLVAPNGIDRIQIAPGGVVTESYPDVESERGRDLFAGRAADETHYAAIHQCATLAGLFQDDEGSFIEARVPIYVDGELWGMLGARLAFPGILKWLYPSETVGDRLVHSLETTSPSEGGTSLMLRTGGEAMEDRGVVRFRVYNQVWSVETARRHDFAQTLNQWLYLVGVGLVALLVAALGSHYAHLVRIKAFMENMAMTDGLTGLPNRRRTMQALAAMVEQSRRTGKPFVLLYMDLDGFKQVNDTYGHEKGDRVLIRTANILRDNIKDLGMIGRVGGDEFVFLFEDMRPGDILDRMIEVLRKKLRMSVSGNPQDTHIVVPVSASFGIASYPQDGQDAETILHAADVRMYTAKKRAKGTAKVGPFARSFR